MTSKELARKITLIEDSRSTVKSLNKEILAYCQDKSNPFQARWTVWYDYVSKDNHPWIYHFNNKEVEDKISKYCINRYETVNLERILSIVEDVEETDIIALKEELMQNNLGSFKVDW